ncbi:MAG: HPr family phosphocarrier protein [Lachnospiraceae bacterium]|nr:HPr family phosphocarrier protein [Lachnospiraceae bacterium]
MITKKININIDNNQGARPVALLVQVASRFECHIDVEHDNKKVNAKSIMGMMSLGLACGQDVVVYAEGSDENEAIGEIEKCLCS